MSHDPILPGLFSEPRRMADTSIAAFDRIRPTLTERERACYLALYDFGGSAGLTGGELAEAMGSPITSVRPRLTGLFDKGWVQKGAIRVSRVRGEGRARPYFPAVPRSAVERVK